MITAITDDPLPPIPDVAFMIGIAPNLGPLHAIEHRAAAKAVEYGDTDSHRVHAPAECGATVVIARRWGAFMRGNHYVRGRACPACAWAVALDQNMVDAELAAIAPTGGELAALQRLLPDPLLAVRICERILDERRQERDYDADSPYWAQLLGHATAHSPAALVPEDCAEGECEHEDTGEENCFSGSTAVACPACSVRAGSWAGEWEGQFELVVPAPCSVLAAMAKRYEVEEAGCR